MDPNPYAPPVAEVADIRPTVATVPPFFAVSLFKLLVLSTCTLLLYQLYWFYRNWQLIRMRERSSVSPALRTLFAILFCYACFKRIRKAGVEGGIAPPLQAGLLAAAWTAAVLAQYLPGPGALVSLAAVLILLPVQSQANRINAAVAPGHDRNAGFSVWNWLAIVPGWLLVLLAVIGVMLPTQ